MRETTEVKETFVIEMIRHGAVSHDLPNAEEFFGVPSGHLTKHGWSQAAYLGRKRFSEYNYLKEYIAWKYNPNAFLSLGPRTHASKIMGEKLMRTMYPLYKWPKREVNFITKFTPIRGTSFEHMIQGVYYESGMKICLASHIQLVPKQYDTMLET